MLLSECQVLATRHQIQITANVLTCKNELRIFQLVSIGTSSTPTIKIFDSSLFFNGRCKPFAAALVCPVNVHVLQKAGGGSAYTSRGGGVPIQWVPTFHIFNVINSTK